MILANTCLLHVSLRVAPDEQSSFLPTISLLMEVAIHFEEVILRGEVANQLKFVRLLHVTQHLGRSHDSGSQQVRRLS